MAARKRSPAKTKTVGRHFRYLGKCDCTRHLAIKGSRSSRKGSFAKVFRLIRGHSLRSQVRAANVEKQVIYYASKKALGFSI